ncbi:hypothetical protein ACROYT_G007711 [Oculina patagonica]
MKLREANLTLQKELQEIQARLDNSQLGSDKPEIDQERVSQELCALQNQLAQLEKEAEERKIKIAQMEQASNAKEMKWKVTNSSLKQELKELQERLENTHQTSEMKEAYFSQEISALSDNLAAYKAEIVKQTRENKELKLTSNANETKLREANNTLQKELQKLQERLDNSQLGSDRPEIDQERVSLELCALHDQLAQLEKQAGESKMKIVQMELASKEKVIEIKKVKKNAFLAKGRFLQKKAEVEKLNNELQSIKECENNLTMKNSSLEENIQELRNRLEELKAENIQLLEKSEKDQARLCELNDELEAYKSKLDKEAERNKMVKEQLELTPKVVIFFLEWWWRKWRRMTSCHTPPLPPPPLGPFFENNGTQVKEVFNVSRRKKEGSLQPAINPFSYSMIVCRTVTSKRPYNFQISCMEPSFTGSPINTPVLAKFLSKMKGLIARVACLRRLYHFH